MRDIELKPEYELLKLPKSLREDVHSFCRLARCEIDEIWGADPKSVWEMSKAHGLIRYLGSKGHVLSHIIKASKQSDERCLRVLQIMRQPDVPIRTTNWERR